jgi:hypothetical protein
VSERYAVSEPSAGGMPIVNTFGRISVGINGCIDNQDAAMALAPWYNFAHRLLTMMPLAQMLNVCLIQSAFWRDGDRHDVIDFLTDHHLALIETHTTQRMIHDERIA